MTDRILRIRDVVKIVGMSKATIYRRAARGEFPEALKLGPGAVGWRESAIVQWMDELPKATSQAAA